MAGAPKAPQVPGDNVTLWGSVKAGVRESGIPWLFILPSFLVMLVITFSPQAYQIYLSFFDFTVRNLTDPGAAPFVNIENYRRVLFEGLNVPNYSFFPLLGFNIVWTIINVFFHVVLGVVIALVLNAPNVIGRRFYRTLYLIPWGMPILITGLIWNNMWQKNGGGVNLVASSLNDNFGTNLPTDTDWLGLQVPPVDARPFVPAFIVIGTALVVVLLGLRLWRKGVFMPNSRRLDVDRVVWTGGPFVLAAIACVATVLDIINGSTSTSLVVSLFDRAGAPVLAFYAVLTSNIWLGWPFMMVVATGALQSIPPSLYEAAEVDGADSWYQFWQITVPLIRPAMVPAIMLGTIWTFNQFNVIFFITAGGPRGQTDLLITQAYKLIQQEQLYGAAAAFSMIVFLVLLMLTLINNRLTRATEAFDA